MLSNNYSCDSNPFNNSSKFNAPDATNQIYVYGINDNYLNYVFNNYCSLSEELTGTITNSFVTYVGHHVGGFEQFHYIIENTHGANSLNVKIQFSENGSDWFDAQGYTAATGVTVALGSYNSFSSENTHHFYRVQIQSTVGGSHATFKIYWNYVSQNN